MVTTRATSALTFHAKMASAAAITTVEVPSTSRVRFLNCRDDYLRARLDVLFAEGRGHVVELGVEVVHNWLAVCATDSVRVVEEQTVNHLLVFYC